MAVRSVPDTDLAALLPRDAVHLGLPPADRDDVVRRTGDLLVELGNVTADYVATMHEREAMVSSFVGAGVAIPHGTDEGRAMVQRAGLTFLQYPEGVDWDGQTAHVVIGIAAAEDEHLLVMSRLATVMLDPDKAERLHTTGDVDEVLQILVPADAEN
jgi:mannitol/fructose-specific phosphotransferase system IIA component